MFMKLWHIKGVFVVIALIIAFAACVKKKDPNLERNQIKDVLNEIVAAVNKRPSASSIS